MDKKGCTLSRRTLLAAAGMGTVGLGTAALFGGCDNLSHTTGSILAPAPTPTPNLSPLMSGPYQTGQMILGKTPGTTAMPIPRNFDPKRGAPSSVKAAVYYPADRSATNQFHVAAGRFPLLLYAHAVLRTDGSDFTSVATMLSHVASYGAVCVAPDLDWAVGYDGLDDNETQFGDRGVVLFEYYQYLVSLNAPLFANQLDPKRLVLVGHSTGAGGATFAGRVLKATVALQSLAYGLIAPEFGGDSGPDTQNLLVLGGTLDGKQEADPGRAYSQGGTPKTLVMIDGANHFGYTDACPPDNSCSTVTQDRDNDGTISRTAQQQTGAAYLAALLRYYTLGDSTARPYLSGQQPVEGLDAYGVSVQVSSAGFKARLPTPLPTGGTLP